MKIIVDTSVLIYYFFGNNQEKIKIHRVFSSKSDLFITTIIKYEFRNIFLDFFRLKKIMQNKMNLIRNKEINYNEFAGVVLEQFSENYYHKSHVLGRIRILFQNLLNEYFKIICAKSIQYLNEEENQNQIILFFLDRIETIIFNFEIKLNQIYAELRNFGIIKDFDCLLSDWKFYYDSEIDEFKIDNEKTCSKVKCNFNKKIVKFSKDNNSFIKTTIDKYLLICEELKIKNPDKKMINTLKDLNLKLESSKNSYFSVKICRNLGDFFISSILNEESQIYTKNVKDFLPLLKIKNLDNIIILK
jgi:predicted nucleic acid-binding protein